MTFSFTEESKTNREKLIEQGVDLQNIRVTLEGLRLVNGELHIDISPTQSPKDKYELDADPKCSTCKGGGWIRYWLAQDDSKAAPCHVCFPETAAKSEWLREAMR